MKRPRRRVAKIAAVIAVMFAGSLVAGAVALHRAVDHGVRQQLAGLESRLGRSVTVGSIELDLIPSLRLQLRDVRVGPARGSHGVAARPLVAIEVVRASVPWAPLVRSRGRSIEVESL